MPARQGTADSVATGYAPMRVKPIHAESIVLLIVMVPQKGAPFKLCTGHMGTERLVRNMLPKNNSPEYIHLSKIALLCMSSMLLIDLKEHVIRPLPQQLQPIWFDVW